MKHAFLIFVMACVTAFNPALAEEDAVTNLSGNARIVNRERPSVYNGDESLVYQTLVKPYKQEKRLSVPNTVPMATVQENCGEMKSPSRLNRCIRDAIKRSKRKE